MTTERQPLIIYHRGCMDGAGAAFAAWWLHFGDMAEYLGMAYGDIPPADDTVRDRQVYMLDYSFKREVIEHIYEVSGRRLMVLDHHKSAEAELANLPYCIFDMNRSGAMIAWNFFADQFQPNARVPEVIAYIQDRDLWKWQLPNSKEISAALWAQDITADFRKLLPLALEWTFNYERLRMLGAALLAQNEQYVQQIAKTAESVMLGGFKALAATTPLLRSEAGEALALKSEELGGDCLGILWYRDGEAHIYRVSLRSRKGGPDVAAIAAQFGGGGHAAAAGFEVETLPWEVVR